MKLFVLILLFCNIGICAPPNAIPKERQKETLKETPKVEVELTKIPKSLFLVKRAKIDSSVGEPLLHIYDQQLRNIIYENNFKATAAK